jgi:hypothetical protein
MRSHPSLRAQRFASGRLPGQLYAPQPGSWYLVWAATDRISMDYRPIVAAPQAPATRVNDIVAVVLGLALYVAFATWLHAWLFGVPVITP